MKSTALFLSLFFANGAYPQWSALSPGGTIPTSRFKMAMCHVPPSSLSVPGFPNGISFLTEGSGPITYADNSTFYFNHSGTQGVWTNSNFVARTLVNGFYSIGTRNPLSGPVCPVVNGVPQGNLNNCACSSLTSSTCILNVCCAFLEGVEGTQMVFWNKDHLGNTLNLLLRYGGVAKGMSTRLNQFWVAPALSLVNNSVPSEWEHYINQTGGNQVPSPRIEHRMVYIPWGSGTHIDGKVVLVGGDTGNIDNTPQAGASSNIRAVPTYIAGLTVTGTSKQLNWRRVFNAPQQSTGPCSDTDHLDGVSATNGVTVLQKSHNMYWDTQRKVLVKSQGFLAFGGHNLDGTHVNYTMEWDGKFVNSQCQHDSNGQFVAWKRSSNYPLAPSPLARGASAHAWHGGIKKPITYGGREKEEPSQISSQYRDGTHQFTPYTADSDRWKPIPASNAPGPRAYGSSVYVPVLNKIFMFGGFLGGPGTSFNDSWYYQPSLSNVASTVVQNIACRPNGATANTTLSVLSGDNIGAPLVIRVSAPSSIPNVGTSGVLYVGVSPANYPLDHIGMTGCTAGTSTELSFLFALNSSGYADVTVFNTPNDFAWVGIQLFAQAILINPGVNPAGFTASDGINITVGQ